MPTKKATTVAISRDDRDCGRSCEAREVRRRGAARDEGADDYRDARRERERLVGILREDVHEAADLVDAPVDGIDAEHRDERHGDAAEHGERLDAEVGRDRHDDARYDDERPHRDGVVDEPRDRNRKHRDADAEPAYLREADERGGEERALVAERAVRKKVESQPGALADVAEQAAVDAEESVAEYHSEEEFLKIKSDAEVSARGHAGREECEADEDDHRGPEPLHLHGGGDCGERPLAVFNRFFHYLLSCHKKTLRFFDF